MGFMVSILTSPGRHGKDLFQCGGYARGYDVQWVQAGEGDGGDFIAGVNRRLDGVAFVGNRAHINSVNNPLPKLLLTKANGKRRSFNLVSASNSQRPNEIQVRELDQVHRRLPPHILEEMSARKLSIPPHEIGLLLSCLKAAADLSISLGD
jgi:hypothetical protein